MSKIFDRFPISSLIEADLRPKVKYFDVFDDWNNIGKDCLFVTTDDKVYALEDNSHGVCGIGHCNKVTQPQQLPQLTGMVNTIP